MSAFDRLMAIKAEMDEHQKALDGLRTESEVLIGEVGSCLTGLGFGSLAIAKGKASKPKAVRKDGMTAGIKLAIKRAVLKAQGDKKLAATLAEQTARKFAAKKGVEVPTWVSEWAAKLIDKTFPQSQGDAPTATTNETNEVQPSIAEEPKSSKRRKK
jgi:hypothetical protein